MQSGDDFVRTNYCWTTTNWRLFWCWTCTEVTECLFSRTFFSIATPLCGMLPECVFKKNISAYLITVRQVPLNLQNHGAI